METHTELLMTRVERGKLLTSSEVELMETFEKLVVNQLQEDF